MAELSMDSPVPINTSKEISERLQRYLEGEQNRWSGFEAEARSLGALPIHISLFTSYFIRPDGELFSFDLGEKDSEPNIVKDMATRLIVIHAATEWLPELKALLPQRPDNACDCLGCGGRGELPFVDYYGRQVPVPCPKCMSLGWVET